MFKNSFPGLGKQQFKPKCQRFECSDTGFTYKQREISRQCSSAVERARSMLQRSRNTGLCSRLNQRERLRASSPSPSLGSNRGKKPKEPEQSKPFEFALVYDEPDKEDFVINNGNILLQGLCIWSPQTARQKSAVKLAMQLD